MIHSVLKRTVMNNQAVACGSHRRRRPVVNVHRVLGACQDTLDANQVGCQPAFPVDVTPPWPGGEAFPDTSPQQFHPPDPCQHATSTQPILAHSGSR